MAKKEDKDDDLFSAQRMIDAAPSDGKSGYIKLPEGLKFFVPQKNKTYKLIFLPFRAGAGNTSAPKGEWALNRFLYVHRNVGAGEESFACLAKTQGKPCPICENYNKLRAAGADYDTVLKHIKYKDRELMLVHDTEQPKSLFVWDESVHLFGDSFRQKIRKKAIWMNYAHPTKGCIVEVDAQEKKMGKSSCTDCTKNIEIEPRTEPLDDFLKKAMEKYCLDDYVVYQPYSKLAKLVKQAAASEEEKEEEEETEAEEAEEVEEAEEEPAKKPGKKPAKKEEAEEEEETEAEEEETEEAEEEETEEEETEEEETEEEETEEEETEEEETEEAPKKGDSVKYNKMPCKVIKVTDTGYVVKNSEGKVYRDVPLEKLK